MRLGPRWPQAYPVRSSQAVGNLGQSAGPYDLRVGHPGGVLEVAAEVHAGEEGIMVSKALIGRTARLLMDGTTYIR